MSKTNRPLPLWLPNETPFYGPVTKKHRPRPRKPKNRPRHTVVAADQLGGDGPVYYHGGPPGLAVGSHILPRALTGARAREVPLGYASTITPTPALALQDDTGVYITTSLKLAVYYAAGHKSGKGGVYEVEPDGEVTPDPDYPGRTDVFRCARARIKAVAKVPFGIRQLMRDRLQRVGFRDLDAVVSFLHEHDLGAENMINIADEIEKHVSKFATLGFPPATIAVALTAAATEIMLHCSKREAWEKATAAWAGVIEGMNKRAADRA